MPAPKKPFNSYRIIGDVAYMAITDKFGAQKHEAMLDISDLRRLESEGNRWSSGDTSRLGGTPKLYVYRGRGPGLIYLHRHLMQSEPGVPVDHLNGNSLDCRRTNMRVATFKQNNQNKTAHRNSQTGVRGVYPLKRGNFPYRVAVGRGIFALKVRTLNIGRITASLARAQHWGAEAA